MTRTLRGQTALTFLSLSLGSIVLVSLLAHLQIQRHLALYYRERVEEQAQRVAAALARTYEPGRGWPDPVLAAVTFSQPPEVRGLVLEDATGRTVRHGTVAPAASPGTAVSRPVVVDGTTVAWLRLYPAMTTATRAEVHFRAGVTQAIGLAAVLAGLLATAAAGFAVGRLHRPLRDMTAVAQAIRAGDRDARAPRPAVAELRQLADALNDLAAWLQQSEALRRRVTRDVAHQLRTPLAVLRSHLEALRDGVWEPTPERIALCHGEVLKLVRRVEDLDRLVEAEAAALSLQRDRVTLRQLLDPVASSFAPLFARHGLDFRYLAPQPDGALCVDPDKVAQILSNLLDNALKYAPPGATVVLAADAAGDEARVSVSNTGPGIPEEEIPHLFERFFRGEVAHSGSVAGTGRAWPSPEPWPRRTEGRSRYTAGPAVG